MTWQNANPAANREPDRTRTPFPGGRTWGEWTAWMDSDEGRRANARVYAHLIRLARLNDPGWRRP